MVREIIETRYMVTDGRKFDNLAEATKVQREVDESTVLNLMVRSMNGQADADWEYKGLLATEISDIEGVLNNIRGLCMRHNDAVINRGK